MTYFIGIRLFCVFQNIINMLTISLPKQIRHWIGKCRNNQFQ